MSRDPFRIEGPACISFSGGRTSGYMLHRILQAHGGTLPDDVVVLFANTGKEHESTLDFVRDVESFWNVPITWLEYRAKVGGEKQYAIVSYETASRNGEPFDALLAERAMLPNVRARFCSSELKTRTMHRHIRQALGFTEWDAVIGLRADEPRRVSSIRARGFRSDETSAETMVLPLAESGVGSHEVGRFWEAQPFDLALPNNNGKTLLGNCDLCYLKQASTVLSIIRAEPNRAIWWAKHEQQAEKTATTGARFADDRPSYAEMHRMATTHGELFPFSDESIEDCACTD